MNQIKNVWERNLLICFKKKFFFVFSKKKTKQEKIIVALMRGHHLEPNELDTAKQQLQILKLILKSRVLWKHQWEGIFYHKDTVMIIGQQL